MTRKKLREELQQIIDAHQGIKICRDRIDTNPIYGFPLKQGKEILLVQYQYDFQLDGYQMILLEDITAVRSDEYERFSELIFKNEGQFDQIRTPIFENINNWEVVFKQLKLMGTNIIVECESLEENDFYIGEIVAITKTAVQLLYFDGLGVWDEEATEIPFTEITSVSFESRYINIISKYVQPKVK